MTIQANKNAELVDFAKSTLGVTADGTAVYLNPYQQHVELIVTSGTIIYLPPLAESAGKIYSLRYRSGSGTVTIDSLDDSVITDTLTLAGHLAAFYCTGTAWMTLFSST